MSCTRSLRVGISEKQELEIRITRLMDIDINSPSANKPHRIKRTDYTQQVIIRTLICCLILDLTVWGYFRFVKDVSLSEGLIGWQNSIRDFVGLNNQQAKKKTKYVVIDNRKKPSKTYRKTDYNTKEYQQPNIYKWKDKDGTIHFSNTTYPLNNSTLEVKKELNHFSRETKYTYKGGTILIPVTITNNGRRETIKLILDTGCGTTQIHPDVVKRLRAKTTGYGKSFVADGRTIKKTYARVDSLQVGPFKEQNFKISTNYIQKKHGIDGLLGMNFLRKHPFDIDTKRRVIRWE